MKPTYFGNRAIWTSYFYAFYKFLELGIINFLKKIGIFSAGIFRENKSWWNVNFGWTLLLRIKGLALWQQFTPLKWPKVIQWDLAIWVTRVTVGNSKEASRQSSTATVRHQPKSSYDLPLYRTRWTSSSIFYIESSETDFHTILQRRVLTEWWFA